MDPQPKTPVAAPRSNPSTPKPPTKTDSMNLVKAEYGTFMTVATRVRNPETQKTLSVRLFLDPGSSRSYVHARVKEAIELKTGNEYLITMRRFNDQEPMTFPSATVKLEVLTPNGQPITIVTNTTPEITENMPVITPKKFVEKYPQYANIQFADMAEDWPVDLLIGNDYAFKFITCKEKIDVDSFQIIHSVFGYLITGHNGEETTEAGTFFSTTTAIEKIASLDIIGIKDAHQTRTEEEEAALQQFYTHVKMDNNRYEVPLLWKMEPSFPGTFGLAIGRLRSNIKRLEKNKEILIKYDEIFKQQMENGIIEEAGKEPDKDKVYYIPHQPVIDLSKTTTPIRIVFDASAKAAKNTASLNEMIYKGVTRLEEITALLARFRTYKVAIVADIEKAYHMLQLRSEDRDFCRFLWVKDLEKPVDNSNVIKYRFRRIAFGLTSSQFLLNATIANHINNNESEFSKELKNDFYVDNLISGTQSVIKALQFHNTSIRIFEKCSMNLRCWTTNSMELRDKFQPEKKESESIIKTLGLKWDTNDDVLYLPSINLDSMKMPTLRLILKYTAKIYDPMGYFAPVTVQAKMLMQAIRQAGYLWDDPLPMNMNEEWNDITHDMKNLHTTKIKRYMNLQGVAELHVFSDASAKAYGVAAYIKANNETFLIFAKARVAPMRTITIPKLELLAATIAARTVNFIRTALRDVNIEKATLWTDSKCVIAQTKTTRILPTYTENRVREIRAVENLEIKYVPTSVNIADIASRGCRLNDLPNEWWTGPKFLIMEQHHWPKQDINLEQVQVQEKDQILEDTVMIVKEETKNQETKLLAIDTSRFNSMKILLGTAARVIRFILMKVPKMATKFPQLVTAPRRTILRWYLKQQQKLHYADVYDAIEKQKTCPLIRQFRIIKDENDILRCRGRFEYCTSPQTVKFPILLPPTKKSEITKKIIVQAHENNFHAGTNHTLAALRRQYWIPSGRASVYNVIKKCTKCKRYTALPYKQPSGAPLPECRITSNQYVWQSTGFDIFGHIIIEEEKLWVLICTCMTTRAVSLEPLEALTAEHTMIAFRAFVARRATPKLMLSDQGSQFQPVIEILQNNVNKDIEWKKIPAKSPWMGGVYERLIGITKNAFNRTFHKSPMTKAMFRTILYEIENVVNSRPITYLESDIGYEALTPNHFLMKPNDEAEMEPTNVTGDRAFLQALWKFMSNAKTQFWSIWRDQYLALLRERHSLDEDGFKKRTNKLIPHVNTIVLISEANQTRKNWTLARIVELPKSHDGQIRSARLKLPSGNIISRPIQEIYPMEIEDESESNQLADQLQLDQLTDEVVEVQTNLDW